MPITADKTLGFYIKRYYATLTATVQRLAFTSMNSMPLEAAESGLQRLSSLTNLQSLHLNANDVGPVLEAMPSVPATLRSLKLHLTGDNWQSSVLDKIATQLGAQVGCGRSWQQHRPERQHTASHKLPADDSLAC